MSFSIPHPIVGSVPVTVTTTHRLFDDLVAAEAGVAVYLGGHMLHAGSTVFQGPIWHVCLVEQAEVECEVSPLVRAIVNQSWPTTVQLSVCAMPQPPYAARTATPSGVQRLTGSIHANAFLTYYENVKSLIKARHGTDPKQWPDVLKFAWITRNAFGHGGTLDIRDQQVTATWRGLSLSHGNDGEQMLYNHIASGDVVLLMLDVEDLL